MVQGSEFQRALCTKIVRDRWDRYYKSSICQDCQLRTESEIESIGQKPGSKLLRLSLSLCFYAAFFLSPSFRFVRSFVIDLWIALVLSLSLFLTLSLSLSRALAHSLSLSLSLSLYFSLSLTLSLSLSRLCLFLSAYRGFSFLQVLNTA